MPKPGYAESNAKSREYQKRITEALSECLASRYLFSILCYLWSYWCFQEHYFAHRMQLEDLFEKLLVLDLIALSANIELLVADEDKCNELVETSGPGAQSLVNLLHAVCLQVVYFLLY